MIQIEHNIDGVVYMTSPNISVPHAFTTRFGGVSRGVYASLNLGLNYGDDDDNVKENYSRIRKAVGFEDGGFACSRQVHGAFVKTVSLADSAKLPMPPLDNADGLITRDTGVTLVIFVADCVPILLYDPIAYVIGAVHSGWRGTGLDIVGAAVRKMADEFGSLPSNIHAAIGPSISKCCYETGIDVADAMHCALGSAAEHCVFTCGDKYFVDLKEANALLLKLAGVHDISVSDECTSCCHDKYWSYRRTNTLRGSQAAMIQLKRKDT